MGNAKYCDRCKELYNTAEIEVKKVTISGAFDEDLVADLCPVCIRSIEAHLWGDDLKKKK